MRMRSGPFFALALVVVVMGLVVPGPAPASAQGGDQLLFRAYTCETDPGSIGMLPPPADCADAAGVEFVVTTEDGGAVGSCTTSDLGACTVRVLLGTTVILTEELSTVPEGYAPTNNPQRRQTPPPPGASGEFIAEFINVRQSADDGGDGGGTLTVYRTDCPAGYQGSDYFADCFGNPVAEAEFAIGTEGTGNVASGVTGANGLVTFPLAPYLLGQESGRIGVGEVGAGTGAPPAVACSKNAGESVAFEASGMAIAPVGEFYAIALDAEASDEIRCDWYGIAAGTAPPPVVEEEASFSSGGIGLTRAAWEGEHGAGEAAEVVSPTHDEVYGYEEGTYYAAFEGSKGEDEAVVVYLEVVWGDEGVAFEEAQEAVEALLPTDAERLESPYEAPPTPGGSVALRAWRYASGGLATVPYGTTTLPPELVVVYQLIHADVTPAGGDQEVIETTVTRASIMTRLPVG